ncbi:type IV secretion system protein [Bradyrhizobium sp. Ai1a-2]|uniref:type IV secretion system protein n=1 Tax=Bradyrhizobium sp. Ai1a-2 TaxID=196490 RepID=UPI0004015E73|nr:type IV secretion system protein [Bradyrhizobium sp. Ai1a-2]
MTVRRIPTIHTSVAVLALLMASPAGAEIVFDPSVYTRQFEQLTELKKQVDTLTSQLKVAQDQLNQASSSMTASTSGPMPTTSARS